MRCSKCGVENPDRAKFCEECASPFTRRCHSCDTENSRREILHRVCKASRKQRG